MKNVLYILAVISLMFSRPMALGNGYTTYGLLALLVISALVKIRSYSKNNVSFSKINLFVCIGFLFQILYVVLEGRDVFVSIILMSIPIICANFLFNNPKDYDCFFVNYKNLVVILCLGAILTEIARHFYSERDLLIGVLDFKRNNFTYYVYWPFSTTQMYFITDENSYMRHNIFFGEPGIAPTFILPAIYISLIQKGKIRAYFETIVMTIGAILTLSTTFVVLFPAAIIIYYYLTHKVRFKSIIIILLLISLAVLLYLYFPIFGYYDKVDSAYGSSFEARENMVRSIGKQFAFIISILITWITSKYKNDKIGFKLINYIIAIGALSNIIYFTTLHILFLYYDRSKGFAHKSNVEQKLLQLS